MLEDATEGRADMGQEDAAFNKKELIAKLENSLRSSASGKNLNKEKPISLSLDGGKTWVLDPKQTRRRPIWDDLKRRWSSGTFLRSKGSRSTEDMDKLESSIPRPTFNNNKLTAMDDLNSSQSKRSLLTIALPSEPVRQAHNHGESWFPRAAGRVTFDLDIPAPDGMPEAHGPMELDSRPGSRRAKASSRDSQPTPAEFVVPESASIWVCGINEHGELGKGDTKEAAALCQWPAATLEKHRLAGRVESITLGWYHGIICVAPRWRAPLPPNYTHSVCADA